MEKERLTLSAIFIATYTTLIFTIPQVYPGESSLIHSIVYLVFVIFGLAIDFILFLYISFYALELSSIKELPHFDIEINKEKIKKIKDRIYNTGVYLIFFSIGIPLVALPIYSLDYLGFWGGVALYSLCLIIVTMVIRWLINQLSK